jgi:hypothetical protein
VAVKELWILALWTLLRIEAHENKSIHKVVESQ